MGGKSAQSHKPRAGEAQPTAQERGGHEEERLLSVRPWKQKEGVQPDTTRHPVLVQLVLGGGGVKGGGGGKVTNPIIAIEIGKEKRFVQICGIHSGHLLCRSLQPSHGRAGPNWGSACRWDKAGGSQHSSHHPKKCT